uniref:Retrovirus-related Pol polyprotein from transposon TNT 1-94 n=1 Tax=Tanacetum cinerariifolium TaxID=118510 RepID=A0A699I6D0_TANCI|nr:retrovirus-related Pol polyprotein from transposon TNT 1-94 [Tanacetum cinerariifolium]
MNENRTSRGPVKWQRVLLKVSGEVLTGDREQNINPKEQKVFLLELLALEVLPADMEAQTKAELKKKAHSSMILCLGNKVLREVTRETTAVGVWSKLFVHDKVIGHQVVPEEKVVKFMDGDLALLLLTSLPTSYEHFVDTLLYGWEALTLEDVMVTLNSKEIKERSKAKGDDGEGLYVRGRTDRRDSHQSRRKSRSKSRGGRLKCYICQSEDLLKRNCSKNNRKKSTGYVKKDEQPSANGLTYDDYEVMIVMSAQVHALLDWIMDVHMTPMLDKFFDFLEYDGAVYSWVTTGSVRSDVLLGKVKVINSSRVNLSRIRRDNCVYSLDGHAMAGELNVARAKSGQMHSLGYSEGVKGYRLYRLDDESPKIVTSKNVVFNESVLYKDTLKDSGAGDKSVKELQVEVELQRLNNHMPKEDQTDEEDGDDEDAGD